ncbi:MAG: SGNH/GDSL hydrolase family protein [Planctomycetes bacterium]|nr:SGNH/GDSL hydrolase family protein [Planctomycetota bacterium]
MTRAFPIQRRAMMESMAVFGLVSLLAWTASLAGEAKPERVTRWHGYEHHFRIDDRTAYVVLPKRAAPGRPWVWRARFPNYHAEMDVALLDRGFHIGYVDVAGLYGSPKAVDDGNRFYAYVTERYKLSKKPALEGVSRGGLFVYNWAAANPDKVACIYCDTPVMDIKSWPGGKGAGVGAPKNWQECLRAYGLSEEQAMQYRANPIDHVTKLVQAGIPILHIVSENDRVVPPAENTYLARNRLPDPLRRRFQVISVAKGTAESQGHHFRHPAPQRVVRFIVQHALYEGGYVSSSVSRTLEQVDAIYATMPPLRYQPPKGRWKHLPRTMHLLREGPALRIVMLGDSIINDTSRSQWHLLLERAYPKCRITKITSVRGSTGCWWYKQGARVQLYVLGQRPDLVIIGGISQRDDIESIREVVRQIRAGSKAEILLMTGAFGRVDPRQPGWKAEIDPDGDDYRARLKRLADELKVEFLDMRGAWGQYIRSCGKDLEWFKRDPIHANERGEQILGRILCRYFAPNVTSDTASTAHGT